MSALPRPSSLPGMARQAKSGLARGASTEDLGTAAQAAAFRPPSGIDRLERVTKRAALAPGTRHWFRFEKGGRSSMFTADKHAIAQQTGVQLRDLRLLDPQLSTSYPSAILARDSALVVNLEFIKALITTEYVLILNADEETVSGFIEELQRRLNPRPLHPGVLGLNGSASSPNLTATHDLGDSGKSDSSRSDSQDLGFDAAEAPFELRVLEVALDVVCNHLERLSADLEAAAHPALDALTRTVSTHNLERVRRIKSRMVRLKTRGETIKEVLEKYLDDDEDMRDMNLTAKAEELLQRTISLQRRSLDFSASGAGDGSSVQPPTPGTPAAFAPTPSPRGGFDFDDDSSDDDDVNEVEMLLEAYFMQVDNTCNKLQTLHEYIDDTEDFINIELDSHRNQLIQLELLLTAAMFALALVTMVAGLFGMNLNNTHESSYSAFVIVTVVSCVGAFLVFLAILLYCRKKKLLCY